MTTLWRGLSVAGFPSDFSPGATATMLGGGAITGVLVSFALRPLLTRFGRWGALASGIFSLPVGAFAFGVITSLIQLMVKLFTGIDYGMADNATMPLLTGWLFACVSSLPPILSFFYRWQFSRRFY
jgi:hypothetical protein